MKKELKYWMRWRLKIWRMFYPKRYKFYNHLISLGFTPKNCFYSAKNEDDEHMDYILK
jgi:hypothetical protein